MTKGKERGNDEQPSLQFGGPASLSVRAVEPAFDLACDSTSSGHAKSDLEKGGSSRATTAELSESHFERVERVEDVVSANRSSWL